MFTGCDQEQPGRRAVLRAIGPHRRVRALDERAGKTLRMSELKGPAFERHVTRADGDGPHQGAAREPNHDPGDVAREPRRHRWRIADKELVAVLAEPLSLDCYPSWVHPSPSAFIVSVTHDG